MKILTAVKVLYTKLFGSPEEREYASFILSEKISGLLYPKYLFSQYGRLWLDDEQFITWFQKTCPDNNHTADRKYTLMSLMDLTHSLSGDTVECGAWKGDSSYMICKKIAGALKTHHIFDSCEGLSAPSDADGAYWQEGDLTCGEEILKTKLSGFSNFMIYKGWIPTRFSEVADRTFSFVHIDVDLYQPTFDSFSFFYPKMIPNGIILLDDYGDRYCPGVKRASDEVIADKPEKIIKLTTGQAFIMKQ